MNRVSSAEVSRMTDKQAQRLAELHQALSNPLLLETETGHLQKLAKRLKKADPGMLPVQRGCRVSLAGGFLLDYLVEVLPLFLAHRGIAGAMRVAPYGTLFSDMLDPASGYQAFDPQVTVLMPSHRDIRYKPSVGEGAAEEAQCIEKELALWQSLWSRTTAPVVQLTFSPPPHRPNGEADGLLPGGMLRFVRRMNLALADAAPPHVSFIDAEALATDLGHGLWQDERMFRLTKQPFAMEALPALCNALSAGIAAVSGGARKVLVLDLDNTLWGGVIGDQGLAGISLGPETAEGEAYVGFQTYIRSLRDRGIVLAVCSKNERDTALEPFRKHGAMVLKEEDIACFVANFENKADNLRAIAKTLNLGLDSFVFVDDSPVECSLVRKELPEVWTVELSGDPSGFIRKLDCINAFPVARLTTEDTKRADSYKTMVAVQSGLEGGSDIDSFLESLAPVAVIEPVGPDTVDRITQLVAKTNQFKLNPTRFSQAEIEARRDNVIALRLKDSLQDYGIVAVAVLDQEDEELRVLNWVMSCRVFSRRLEHCMRMLLAEKAKVAGVERIILSYVPSDRNQLLQPILAQLGFQGLAGTTDHTSPAEAPSDLPAHYMGIETRDASE